MTDLKISFDEIRYLLDIPNEEFPKYATQIINLANQNAQGTRPGIVGQMSDLILEFPGKEYENGYPVIIKPDTYRTKSSLMEKLPDKIIFYSKSKDGIKIQFDF